MFSKENLQLIWNTLKGVEYDYTEGSLKKALVLLAIPMVLELMMESIFAIVDLYFVGGLGSNAIAAVGLTESFISLIYSIAFGLSSAATAIVARRVGEKNYEKASNSAFQIIVYGLIFGLIISFFGYHYSEHVLMLMGAKPEVIQTGVQFTKILLSSSFIITLLFLINGIFRGVGRPDISMKSLWLANLINIILCPILIYKLEFGLVGAAYATFIGRSCGLLYQIYILTTSKSLIQFRKKYLMPQITYLKSIFDLAWPATFQFLITSASWIFITRIVAESGGTTGVAGYQIAIRNLVFFILPAWGISNATATLVGQNLGANKLERAKESIRLSAITSASVMFFVTLIFLLFSDKIVLLFTDVHEVIEISSTSLMILGSGFVFYGIGMVFTQALNGAGDTKTPTLISFICFWILEIPLAYILTYMLHLGWVGAVLAIPIAETMLAILSFFQLRTGKWMKIKV